MLEFSYNLDYHTLLMVTISKKELDTIKNTFTFKKISIVLKITNSQTWMTTHTINWNLKNIGRLDQTRVFYQIGGDTRKKFSELNIKIKDGKGNHLDNFIIAEDKPLLKQFLVELEEPLNPGNEINGLQLKYDWDEPKREFIWGISNICKKFHFAISIPSEIEPKITFFKKDGFGKKTILQPKINTRKNHLEIIWEGKNLHTYDELHFLW